MISAREAQERILERISLIEPLELPVGEAHGCVLAETVTAPEDLPAFTTSAVEGFAVRSEDVATAGVTARSLTIVGEAAGGRPFAGRVAHGEAVRVAAGAAIPEGADAIVPTKDVAVVGSSMAIGRPVPRGENVRPAGEEIARGDRIMGEGQRIRGMDVGVLASLGRTRALVRPRPRLVVFSIGEELRDPGQALGPGLVRDSNAFTVTGMAREAGAEPTRAGIVSGDADALREKLRSFLPQADVFVTSGGLSGSEGDHVRDAVTKLGEMDVWQVSVAPGGRVGVGSIEGRPVFALPGNGVAAVVAFELFVRPALLKMAGRKNLTRPEVDAAIEDPFTNTTGRESYVRVQAWQDASGWRARLAGKQSENIVTSVSGANALGIVPADRRSTAPGDAMRVLLLEPLEGW